MCNDPVLMTDRAARIAFACACSTLLALLLSAPATRAATVLAWHLEAIGADRAWATSTGEGVTVAVIDSGVDADHPDLAGAVLPGRSYVDFDDDAEPRLLAIGAQPDPDTDRAFAHADPVGHGTAVAGLIAGRGGAASGVAPGASILPVRVLDDENRYHDSALVGAAVTWAVDNGADVINLSLGGHYDSPAFTDALAYAERHDVVVVACTGNRRDRLTDEAVWFPAREDNVLAVTGVDRSGARWPTAIAGDGTDVAAPSAELTAPAAGGGRESVTGTSFATAVVSGTAALVRSAHPELTAAQVRHVLTETAEPGVPRVGAGLVDAAAAVEADIDHLAPLPPKTADDAAAVWPVAASAAGGALLGASGLLLRSRRDDAHRSGPARASA
ncbi:hypothetical protein GCM10027447_36920 [Glycomyces halotolerans]